MFETILVPVDGSDWSRQALAHACAIGRRGDGGAVLHGLYVVDVSRVAVAYGAAGVETQEMQALSEMAALRDEYRRQGRAILEEFARRVEAESLTARTELAEGEAGRVICERAGLADLVVLGRHGSGGAVERLIFGSTFEAVVRHSPRPVLVAVGDPRPIRRVLVAYDGSDRAMDALEVAARMAREWGVAVTALAVVESDRVRASTLADALTYLKEHGVEVDSALLQDERPAAAICRVAQEKEADLVVMGGYGHSRFLEVFFGHTVDEVMRSMTRPVLVCR